MYYTWLLNIDYEKRKKISKKIDSRQCLFQRIKARIYLIKAAK